jgi:hypothetical protein
MVPLSRLGTPPDAPAFGPPKPTFDGRAPKSGAGAGSGGADGGPPAAGRGPAAAAAAAAAEPPWFIINIVPLNFGAALFIENPHFVQV